MQKVTSRESHPALKVMHMPRHCSTRLEMTVLHKTVKTVMLLLPGPSFLLLYTQNRHSCCCTPRTGRRCGMTPRTGRRCGMTPRTVIPAVCYLRTAGEVYPGTAGEVYPGTAGGMPVYHQGTLLYRTVPIPGLYPPPSTVPGLCPVHHADNFPSVNLNSRR